jgi:hypothetical protein
VEAFEEEETQVVVAPEPILKVASVEENTQEDPFRAAMTPYLAFLRAVLDADQSLQREEAQKMGKLPDLLADEINDLAAEHTGDILLEECDGGYAVIEDYTEQAWCLLTGTLFGKDE